MRTNPTPFFLLLLLTAGCSWLGPWRPDPYAPRPVLSLDSWRIVQGERLLGRLRHLEIPDPDRPWRYYLVENVFGQWVGWIDRSGRAFRYTPHEKGTPRLCVGSHPRCIQALMGLDRPPRLEKEERGE